MPSDIFLPHDHIGKTNTVIRDPLGKILYVEYEEGDEPDQSETYCCDNCGKEFVVDVESKYKSEAQDEALDFSNLSTNLFD